MVQGLKLHPEAELVDGTPNTKEGVGGRTDFHRNLLRKRARKEITSTVFVDASSDTRGKELA